MKQSANSPKGKEIEPWKKALQTYQHPHALRAGWQLLNTLSLYALSWVAYFFIYPHSVLLALIPAVFSGVILIRVFIIFHDCGHGSFFKSQKLNDWIGTLTGILCFVPYYHWRWEHAIHHATTGDLDKRGVGDVYLMTVEEYLNSTRFKQYAYQLVRNPVFLFLIAPVFYFVFRQRLSFAKKGSKEERSVYITNFSLVALGFLFSQICGFKAYFILQLVTQSVVSVLGVWLFYVQHQFEGVYWERSQNWNLIDAALKGSSFYKLPRVLQWFSGNIGFHHIHHLNSKVPNYNLERCHQSDPIFQSVKTLTLRSSLKTIKLRLWDEKQKKMVGYPRRRKSMSSNA